MKVKELIQKLEQLPAEMEVVIEKINEDFWYSNIENTKIENVRFYDPSDKPCEAFEECVVITDEI